MKLYTEEQVKIILNRIICDAEAVDEYIDKMKPIELPSDEGRFWNDNKPNHNDNYIVHRGAEGVSLGWWNGEEWIEMWGNKKINVYGWIKTPNTPIEWMRDKIQGGEK